MILNTDGPIVQGGVGAALHNINVYFHIQDNVHLRKWADVEQSSLVGLLFKQFTPFSPVKTKKDSLIWHLFRFIQETIHIDLLHIPVDIVVQIINPVVRSLKEAGEIILCACETFDIVLILEDQKICKQEHTTILGIQHIMDSFYIYGIFRLLCALVLDSVTQVLVLLCLEIIILSWHS